MPFSTLPAEWLPRTRGMPLAAQSLYTTALVYCQDIRTDGLLYEEDLSRATYMSEPTAREAAAWLLARGMWAEVSPGVWNVWADKSIGAVQVPASTQDSRREASRRSSKKWRDKQKQHAERSQPLTESFDSEPNSTQPNGDSHRDSHASRNGVSHGVSHGVTDAQEFPPGDPWHDKPGTRDPHAWTSHPLHQDTP